MSSVIEWVKQIFVLSVISNIVIHLMPAPKYEQYAKFICGIIIAAACISPFISFLAKDDIFLDTYHAIVNYENIQELKTELKYSTDGNEQDVIKTYQDKIASDIDQKVLDDGLYPVSTQVDIDTDSGSSSYGRLQKIQLTVSTTKDTSSGTADSSGVSIGQISVGKVTVGQTGEGSSSFSSSNPKVIQLKNDLADFYNLNISNINISINGE